MTQGYDPAWADAGLLVCALVLVIWIVGAGAEFFRKHTGLIIVFGIVCVVYLLFRLGGIK